MEAYKRKCQRLHEIMEEYTKKDVAVAFSGGVDSSLLLKLAVLHGKPQGSRVYAITADTELHPSEDAAVAKRVAEEAGAAHVLLSIHEMEEAGIEQNPIDRCYRCKRCIFQKLMKHAEELGAAVVMEGTNADDLKAYRPGIRAVEELGVKSPLREAGFTKAEVRQMAAEYGISVADRPSTPCLATRFPYGDTLTAEKMQRVEQGEAWLKELGLYNVRLRVHGEIARIEVDGSEMEKLLEHREKVVEFLKDLGYLYITLDLEGFRSGSMDIEINKNH